MRKGKRVLGSKECAYCGSKGDKKPAFIRYYGSGRKKTRLMRCPCGKIYSETYGTVFAGSRLTPAQLRTVLKLMFKGVSIRETATNMKMSPDTVFRARKRLAAYIDADVLDMFIRMGFKKPLNRGLAEYLSRT